MRSFLFSFSILLVVASGVGCVIWFVVGVLDPLLADQPMVGAVAALVFSCAMTAGFMHLFRPQRMIRSHSDS